MTGIPTIQREAFAGVFDEALPLLKRHWREIAHYPDLPLDPDVPRYHALEAAGALRVYTARVGSKLVGYAVFFVAPNAHYKGSLQAVQDVIYVDPDHRRSTIGLRLLRHCEDALRAEGVQAVYHHVKERHPALGQILAHMDYEVVDVIFAKRLDRVAAQTPVSARTGESTGALSTPAPATRTEIWHEPAEV